MAKKKRSYYFRRKCAERMKKLWAAGNFNGNKKMPLYDGIGIAPAKKSICFCPFCGNNLKGVV